MDPAIFFDVRPMLGLDNGLTILYKDQVQRDKLIEIVAKFGKITKIFDLVIPPQFQKMVYEMKMYLQNSEYAYKAINYLFKNRNPFSKMVLSLEEELKTYYQFEDIIWTKHEDSDEDEHEIYNLLRSSMLPRNIAPVTMASLENKERRFHFQVPYGWTQIMVNRILAKFGPIDYIVYLPMQSGPGLTAIIQYIHKLDATLAMENSFCKKTFKCRPAVPRTRRPDETVENIYEIHNACGHWVTKSEIHQHLPICDLQIGGNLRLHHFCGRSIQLRAWDLHLQTCNRRRFDYIKDSSPELRPLLNFLGLSTMVKPLQLKKNELNEDLQGLKL